MYKMNIIKIFQEYDKQGLQTKNYFKRSSFIFNIFKYNKSKQYHLIPMIFFFGFNKITLKKIKNKAIKKLLLHNNNKTG